MANRPSVTQIKARQIKLLRYQITTGKSDAQVAKDFGISSDVVRRVKNATPRQLRKSWNRSPDLRSVYSGVGPVSGKGATKAKGVNLVPVPHTEKQRAKLLQTKLPVKEIHRRISAGDVIGRKFYNIPVAKREFPKTTSRYTEYNEPIIVSQADYWQDYTGALGWRFYTESHNLPQSVNDILDMYYAGEIDDDTWEDIYDVWREMYGIK